MQEIGATGLLEGTGGGGGGGTVDSVVAGAGISVDNTDPANPIVTNTATGGSPAGADTEIQYNDAGAFGASSDFVFNNTAKTFKVMSSANNLLLVDAATGDYGLGDLDGIGNSTRLFIDDTGSVASIAAGGDRIRLNIDGTAFTAKLGDVDSIGNSTRFIIDDAFANKKVTSSGQELVVGALNSTNAPTSDPIAISGIFTGTINTTYTITVNTSSTFDWTDGTNSGTNIPMDLGNPVLMSQGISVTFIGFTYTPTEYWTQAYTFTTVQALLLDYKNGRYSIGDTTGAISNNRIIVDDGTAITYVFSNEFRIKNTANTKTLATFSPNVGQFQMGAQGGTYTYSGNTTSGNHSFYIKDSGAGTPGAFRVSEGNLIDYFLVDPANGLYSLGEGGSFSNGTQIVIDDNTKTVKLGDVSSIGNDTVLTVDDANSKITVNNRFEQDKGADIAAANNLTLGGDGNLFVITGNTQINAITTANRQAGSMITLIFTGTPTVKHNTAGGAGTAVMFLAGSVDLTAAANTVLCLIYDGTQWQETSRKVA